MPSATERCTVRGDSWNIDMGCKAEGGSGKKPSSKEAKVCDPAPATHSELLFESKNSCKASALRRPARLAMEDSSRNARFKTANLPATDCCPSPARWSDEAAVPWEHKASSSNRCRVLPPQHLRMSSALRFRDSDSCCRVDPPKVVEAPARRRARPALETCSKRSLSAGPNCA